MDKIKSSSALSRIDPELMRHSYALRDQVLLQLDENRRPGHVLVLTSCHSGEGVTTVAASLAVALGLPNRWRVLLCDANVQNPGLGRLIAQTDKPGLAEVLAAECSVGEAVLPTGVRGLQVLTAGRRRMPPSQMVESPFQDVTFPDIVNSLREDYAFTIFDAPPLLDYSATMKLATMADGTILVIQAERERYEVARMATGLLNMARAKILGAVLNKRQFHLPAFLYRSL